jgi:hypothetical protein
MDTNMNTHREVMQQALEWAHNNGEAVFAGGGMAAVDGMNAWSKALHVALTEPHEPVAWAMPRPDGTILDVICPEEHARMPGQYTVPLYAEPQPKAEQEPVQVPEGYKLVPVDALTRWRDAFGEELSAWDIDPPLHHVKTSHDEITAMLNAAPEAPQPKAEPQEPVLYVHPSTYAMESANQIGVWRPGCQLDDYLPLYFAPPAPQPRKRLDVHEILDLMPEGVPARYDGELIAFCRAIEAAVWGETK